MKLVTTARPQPAIPCVFAILRLFLFKGCVVQNQILNPNPGLGLGNVFRIPSSFWFHVGISTSDNAGVAGTTTGSLLLVWAGHGGTSHFVRGSRADAMPGRRTKMRSSS